MVQICFSAWVDIALYILLLVLDSFNCEMFPFDSGVSFGHCWLDRQCIMPAKKTKPEEEESNALTCGIIMPIASMD